MEEEIGVEHRWLILHLLVERGYRENEESPRREVAIGGGMGCWGRVG